MESKKSQEIKPVPECKTLGEVMATLNHMVKELNEIPGVRASIGKPQLAPKEKPTRGKE